MFCQVEAINGIALRSRVRRFESCWGRHPFSAASAELLGQCDDDALRAADVTEPIAVLLLLQLADEFGNTGPAE